MTEKVAKRRGHGEGSFRQTPSGKWEGSTWVSEVGKRVYATGETEKKAREALNEKVGKIREGSLQARITAVTFGDYARKVIHERPGIGPRTRDKYTSDLGYYLQSLQPVRLDKITASALRTLYADMRERGLSDYTRMHVHGVIRLVLETARADGILARNVADTPGVRPKAERRGSTEAIKAYTRSQAALLVQAANNAPEVRYAYIVPFLLFTGLRKGEALGLHWEDVNLDKATLKVVRTRSMTTKRKMYEGPPKSRRSYREIPLSPEAVDVLRYIQQLSQDWQMVTGHPKPAYKYVFCNPEGEPLHGDTVQVTLKWIVNRANKLLQEAQASDESYSQVLPLPVMGLHSLRHTFVSLAAASGMRLEAIAKLIGDDPKTMLKVYLHVFSEDVEAPSFNLGISSAPAKSG